MPDGNNPRSSGAGRLTIVLVAITAVTALLLGFVYELTKDQIAESNREKLDTAMLEVMPDADHFDLVEDLELSDPVTSIYRAISGESEVGYCVLAAPKGFGGEIELAIGINSDLTVNDLRIISMSETPGLGTKTNDPVFLKQYIGKSGELKLYKSGGSGDIAAISGATRSSTAITNGVNAAIAAVGTLSVAATEVEP